MNILLSTDNNYVMPTGVLMHSIGINNSTNIHYYILVNDLITEDNKNSLLKIACQYGNDIDFCVIGDDVTISLPFGRDDMPSHVSIATYYRLFLTDILPDDVHKIIYLDGDMVVRKSLEPLWNTDLNEYAIGVVHDQDENKHINSRRLPYPMNTGYFNAGMVLINLDYWRSHDCLKQFVNYISNHREEIVFHDQDVLNSVLYQEKKWISTTYNFQMGFLHEDDRKQYIESIYEEVGETMQDPTIVHYCAADKPWQLYSYNPYVRVWRYYWRKSEWAKFRLEGENPDNLRHRITAFLFRNGLMINKIGRLKKILNR